MSRQLLLLILAVALTIIVVALSVLILFLQPERLFSILFYGIPVGSLIAFGLSIGALAQREPNSQYLFIGLGINFVVFSFFVFWHFLVAGLAGDAYPCLVDASALLVLMILVVTLLRRKRSNP